MLLEPLPKWRRLAIAFGIVIVFMVATGALFIWSGFYNVAATREHFGITTWLLQKIREQSVATQSAFVELPLLDDPALVALGAGHFEGGCAICHGRPGGAIPEIVSHMLPAPPHLEEAVAGQPQHELFWIVKNGLKYTGMPAWPAQERGDEVEAVTAFLARLQQGIEPEAYLEAAGVTRLPPQARRGPANPAFGEEAEPLSQCIRCHDSSELPTLAETVPKLAGQNEAYLLRAMREYHAGDRPSGIMEPVASVLEAGKIRELARHYASLGEGLSNDGEAPSDPAMVERGREIAQRGIPSESVPPCLACHGAGANPGFPVLAGQHARYLERQLELWREGGRRGTAWSEIMASIATRLTAEQARDAAAWFSTLSQTPPAPAVRPIAGASPAADDGAEGRAQ